MTKKQFKQFKVLYQSRRGDLQKITEDGLQDFLKRIEGIRAKAKTRYKKS